MSMANISLSKAARDLFLHNILYLKNSYFTAGLLKVSCFTNWINGVINPGSKSKPAKTTTTTTPSPSKDDEDEEDNGY